MANTQTPYAQLEQQQKPNNQNSHLFKRITAKETRGLIWVF